MQQRREVQRNAVQKRARVLFNQDMPPLDCIVLDLTNHGAGLQLALDLHAPQWFELSFDNFRSRRHCRVMWQRSGKVGVLFS